MNLAPAVSPIMAFSRLTARSAVVVVLAVLALVAASGTRVQAASVVKPAMTISTDQTLTEVVKGLGEISPGQRIEIVDATTGVINTRALCSVTVTVTLYILGAALVAYLASTGAIIALGALAISASQLLLLVGSFISWPAMYAMIDTNICAGAGKPVPTPKSDKKLRRATVPTGAPTAVATTGPTAVALPESSPSCPASGWPSDWPTVTLPSDWPTWPGTSPTPTLAGC